MSTEHATFCVNEQLILSAWDPSVENSEAILNTGLILATDARHGFLKLYGLPFIHQIDGGLDENLFSRIQSDILAKIKSNHVADGDILPEFDCYQNAKGASLPLLLNGMPYSKVEGLIEQQDFQRITKSLAIEPNAELLAIGELLVTSARLSCHFQFQSEAMHYLLVAIEKYANTSWAKQHPTLIEYQQKMSQSCIVMLAKALTPIDYIKLYRILSQSLKNSYLDTL